MAWTELPASSGDLIIEEWYDELKAAIDERADVVSTSKPSDVSGGDLNAWTTITTYRDKIELLIPKFYKKAGSGTSTTFALYDKATIMTDCFGGGVTDWPNKTDKLLMVSHWNDMRTVLNKLEWFKAVVDHSFANNNAQYNKGTTYDEEASAAAVQATWDSDTTEVVQSGGMTGIGSQAIYAKTNGDYGMYWGKWRDRQGISKFTIPDVDINDAYLYAQLNNYEDTDNNPPEQAADYYFYAGTALPGTTFAEIRSYGTLANEGGAAISISTFEFLSYKSFRLDETKLTKNAANYIRGKGKGTVNGELNDATWTWPGKTWSQRFLGVDLYIQGSFAYAA